MRCCGSGIRCFFTPGSGMEKNPDPGSGMNIPVQFSESLETVFLGLKILQFLDADSHPESGTHLPDPQHCLDVAQRKYNYCTERLPNFESGATTGPGSCCWRTSRGSWTSRRCGSRRCRRSCLAAASPAAWRSSSGPSPSSLPRPETGQYRIGVFALS